MAWWSTPNAPLCNIALNSPCCGMVGGTPVVSSGGGKPPITPEKWGGTPFTPLAWGGGETSSYPIVLGGGGLPPTTPIAREKIIPMPPPPWRGHPQKQGMYAQLPPSWSGGGWQPQLDPLHRLEGGIFTPNYPPQHYSHRHPLLMA